MHQAPTPFEKLEDGLYRTELPVGEYDIMARAEGLGFAFERVELPMDGERSLTFPVASSLQVIVVDAVSQQPIERARVAAIRRRALGPPLAQAWTDAEGKATLADLPDVHDPERVSRWLVRAAHPGYATSYADLDGRDAALVDAPVLVELSEGGAIDGRVHLSGRPTGSSHMVVFEARGARGQHPDDEMPRLAVTSADDGTFELSHLLPGTYRYQVFERFLSGDPQTFDWQNMAIDAVASGGAPVAAGEPTPVEIDLAVGGGFLGPRATLRGVVRAGGLALSGAQAFVLGDGERMALTDAAGRFEIVDLPATQLTVQIRAPEESAGHGLLHSEPVALQPDQVHEMTVEIEAQIEAQFAVRLGEEAVPGCRISLERIGGDGGVRASYQIRTDASGTAQVTVYRAGTYHLLAEHPQKGRHEEPIEITRDGAFRFSVSLDPGVPFAGLVECSSRGDPRRGEPYRILVFEQIRDDGHILSERQHQLERDSDAFHLIGMRAGHYRVRLYQPGTSAGPIEFDVGPAGDRHLRLRF